MKEQENETNSQNDEELIEKALLILQKELSPVEFLRFLAIFNSGKGDYLAFKDANSKMKRINLKS
jgi:hypothetical protein